MFTWKHRMQNDWIKLFWFTSLLASVNNLHFTSIQTLANDIKYTEHGFKS